MYLATQAILKTHQDVWESLGAFADASGEFDEQVDSIQTLLQVQTDRKGGTADKAQALNAVVDSAFEITAALLAYARANADDALADTMDFSRSDIVAGRDSEVLARCQNIYTHATELVASLANYGITPAKLSAFKKQTDAFAAVKTRPRQDRATGAAATKAFPELFALADELLNDRLDGLAIQFKDTQPAFYNEYTTARVIVDLRGRMTQQANPVPAALPKAA
jgi:hypothetical protein